MPNYVMNVVKFSPVIPDVEFRAFLSKVMVPAKFPDHEALPANSESDEAVSPLAPVPQDFRGMDFDFNALIPMPKDLDIVSGSETDTRLCGASQLLLQLHRDGAQLERPVPRKCRRGY